MNREVIVIGGGVAGLAVAHQLRGRDVVVLESTSRVGGNIRTLRRDGCTIDLGPDGIVGDVGELGFETITPNMGRTMVAHRGRVLPLPEGLVFGVPRSVTSMATTPLLSLRGKMRAALDLVLPAKRTAQGLGELIEYRMGREVKEALVEPLVSGVHGGPIERLDPEVVMPAIGRGSLIRSLARAPKGKGPMFRAPRRGMDTLIAALARGEIRMKTPVRSIDRAGDEYVVQTDREELRARDVVLAVPPPIASAMTAKLDQELSAALTTVRVRTSASVVLAFDRDDALCPDASGLLVARNEKRSFVAATWVHEKWPERVAPGLAIIRCVVSSDRTPEMTTWSDEQLADVVLQDLRAYVPLERPRWSFVERFEAATPIPELGHRARVQAIRERASRHRGLHLAGAALDGPGIAGCLRGARALAATVASLSA